MTQDDSAETPRAVPVFGTPAAVPRTIGRHRFDRVDFFDDPKLGVKVNYRSVWSVAVNAHLYDLGLSDVPSDIRSPLVLEWFKNACDSVVEDGLHGFYHDMQILMTDYVHLPEDAPDPFCLWAVFAYTIELPDGGSSIPTLQRSISHLGLRTDCGFINMVRYSCHESKAEEGFHDFFTFFTGWTKYVNEAASRPDIPPPA